MPTKGRAAWAAIRASDWSLRVHADSLTDTQPLVPGNPVFECGGTVEVRALPEDQARAAYRPFQAGARFWAKAIGPSTKSSERNSEATAGYLFWSLIAACNVGSSNPLNTASFDARMDIGESSQI